MNDRSSASRESSEHSTKGRRARRLLAALSFAAVVAALALVLVPAAATKGGANRLEARVVATVKGPLPPCDGAAIPCTLANQVQHFIYVANQNEIEPAVGAFRSRETLVNAFVIDSVGFTVSVDGIEHPEMSGIFTPPPNVTFNGVPGFRSASGRWPSTVTCTPAGGGFTDPCNVVGKPAVIPGENTAAFYSAWAHGTVATGEPAGTYVFTFTVHGTFNGTPVDLTASSKKIVMT